MALRAVPEHPKFAALKQELRLPKGAVLGWLEAIWHFAGRFTPHGDIGKYEDAQIESWVEWGGEPGALVAALVKTKWIDKSAEHRLVIHDWYQHADNATKLAVKRSKKPFVCTVSQQCGDTVEEIATVLRLPVPEPVPVPVPEPVLSPDMIATTVMFETSLSSQDLRTNLTNVAKSEMGRGRDGVEVKDALVGALDKYQEAMRAGRLTQYAHPPAKFIGEGVWKDPALWRWKDGQRPARASPDPLEEIRREREAARREMENGSESTQSQC